MRLLVRVPGSCGELVQGVAQGEPFLGTCPVDMYTTVEVSDGFSGIHGLGEKARQALHLALATLGKDSFPYGLRLTSALPCGKGMSSSSADIAAVVAAVQEAFQQDWSAEFIMKLAVQIEPTDGVFFPGIVLMNQLTGRVWSHFTQVPALQVGILDLGGTVNTCDFHAQNDGQGDAYGQEELRAAFEQGMAQNDIPKVLQAATQSAFFNQQRLFKQELEEIWQLGQRAGAMGINIAHSGTVAGLWWPADLPADELKARCDHIAKVLSVRFLRRVRLCSGGVEVRRL